MMMRDFDCFVGIDWSGARGPYQAGLAVFLAEAGHSPPMRVSPPDTQRWSRRAIADWLSDLASRRRVLAGIDFAFAYPIHDMDGSECGYFPQMPNSPQHASALWQLIEDINSDQPYLYGGAIWDHPEYGAYYNAPSGRRGVKFRSRRRQTEQVARAVKSPSPTFNCVGPAGVGTGSLAGMRLLHHFYESAEIWPFANHRAGSKNLTLVEIFPSYYFALAGIRAVKGNHGKIEVLNAALSYFGSDRLAADFSAGGPDFDEADAAISAAALRALASHTELWTPEQVSAREGWIFGVK